MQCFKCATPLPEGSRFCLSCGADVSGETAERTQTLEDYPELMAKLQEDIGTEYLIERELGRGGMAVVYLATDVPLGRKVAIKVLPPDLTFAGGPNIIERFKREARTAATLDHPHIIPIHRVSTGSKLSWYVMKFLEGRTLAEIIEQEVPLPPERAADIISQIAQGLEYAHRRGVVHRDIKPANIALDAEGWVTVSDFGIAKALDTSSLTGSGSMIGTPYYMSPEQCAGQKVSGASDQYSLAVVAYQMLSGHLPFTGQAVVDIIKKHCMDPPPPLHFLRPGLPPAVVAVVERGLEKSPSARFASVTEFAAKFAAAAREKPVETTLPVVRPVAPTRVPATAVVQPVEPPAVVPVVPPVVQPAVLPVVAAQPAQQIKPARPLAQRPPALERRSPYALLGAAIVALGLAGLIFGPLIRQALTRPDSAPTVDVRQESVPAASQAQPRAALPDSQQPAREPAAAPAPPTAERMGTLVLRGVAPGATIFLDGRRVTGPRLVVQLDRRHVVRVEAEGFEAWSREVFASAGQSAITVQMRSLTEPSGLRAPTAAAPTAALPPSQPAQQPAEQPTQLQPAPPTQSTAAAVGYLTVGTVPRSRIFVNGRAATGSPLIRFEVPAGEVRLSFQVTDSVFGTWWADDTVVTVRRDQHLNLRRISLTRQP